MQVHQPTSETIKPPTLDQFSKYQQAYDYFNRSLFGGELAPCLLNFSRHRGAMGFFVPSRWKNTKGQTVHEISLNPDTLQRPLAESMGTLVHEMCHQWQFDHGTPSRNGYHNAEWANKMIEIGLTPSSTGQPGGNPTGQKVSHYITKGGRFLESLDQMPAEYFLPWLSTGDIGIEKSKSKKPKKIKLKCPACQEAYCWIDEMGFEIVCGDCGEEMLSGGEYREAVRERKEMGDDN